MTSTEIYNQIQSDPELKKWFNKAAPELTAEEGFEWAKKQMSMNEEIKYVAYFKTSQQISEDKWEVLNKMREVSDKTTIGEIKEWYKKIQPDTPMDIHITQL